ncbi:DUF6463 family protein [Roseivirga pacifica]|uniref:DUF6463 family protein n=1 Tax=Roseivirga pacifica TaxID=1267423 RepID=UPI003BB1F2A9
MKIKNGTIIIVTGICHVTLGVSPFAFGKQFIEFSDSSFFKISNGLMEFPLMNGQMNFENFSAFWFFYFGVSLLSIGSLVMHIEKKEDFPPTSFIWIYLITVLVGVYMIPLSGMTFLMLPHAIYMLRQKIKK